MMKRAISALDQQPIMSFRDFLEDLRSSGSIDEISRPVSPYMEAAALSVGGKPLFFSDLDGHRGCMNILGSRDLLAQALGITSDAMASHLAQVEYSGRVVEVDSSPFQEVVGRPDLRLLPVMTHFKGDGGPYITSGVVTTELDGHMNACVHRLMVLGCDRLATRLVPGRHTHLLYEAAIAEGRPLPVGIAIGVDPIVLIAASTRVPKELEFEYASALRGEPVELVRLDNGVRVPHAEVVLEGYITGERADEGPFVDITGTRDLVRKEPVIHLTKMMTREDFVYQGLLPGGGEHKMLMGIPYEPLIYRAASRVSKVRNVLLTNGGCCYFHAVVQIEKEDESDPRRVIEAAFQAHGSLKHVLVVDADINIYDPLDLEYAIATRMRGDEDLYIYPQVRGSTLDPRSENGITTKVGIDATMRLDKLWKFQRVRS